MTNATLDNKTRRTRKPRFQFSLRTLFIIMGIVAVTAGLPDLLSRAWFLFGCSGLGLAYFGYRLALPIHCELKGDKLLEAGDYTAAIAQYSAALAHHSDRQSAFLKRAECHFRAGNFEAAIDNATESVQLEPKCLQGNLVRGSALAALGRHAEAVVDLSCAMRSPEFVLNSIVTRALCFVAMGDIQRYTKDAEFLVSRQAECPEFCNKMAWRLATAPELKLRNGELALRLAKAACEQSAYNDWMYIDTLAAAHAQVGDFASAVLWAQKSLDLAPSEGKEECVRCLNLYESRLSYCEANTPSPTSQ